MVASELLSFLISEGCRLVPDGDALRVRDPNKVLNDPLREAIRTHKPRLLEELRREDDDEHNALNVLGMTLEEFKQSSLVVKIWSNLLGEQIALVSHKELSGQVPEGICTYTPEEISELKKLDSKAVCLVHRIKKEFDGEILSD